MEQAAAPACESPGVNQANASVTPRSSARQAWAEVLLIFVIFFLHAGWPAPEPNEPHYLGKAKHYWNPDWAADDEFFNSPHTHQVFCTAFGWLTQWLSLAQFAWLGRLLTWALLAWSWRRLSVSIVERRWASVLSAAMFVCLHERLHMAGEWVVGGFEAKGFAYVLVFLALEQIVRGRFNAAWLLLGAASSLHVLVGGWSTVAAGFAWLCSRGNRSQLAAMWPGLAGGFLLALPGVWPALALSRGASADAVLDAGVIYVFERLPHHLDPASFPGDFVTRHVLLLIGWLILCAATPVSDGAKRLRWFVNGAVLIAAAGFLIRAVVWQPEWAAQLLRFYWFRLSDAMLPLGFSLTATTYLIHVLRARPGWGRAWLTVAVLISGFHVIDYGLQTQLTDRPRADKPGKTADYEAWLDVCRWIRENTPPDARFLTLRSAQTFKWYTGRAEVATWKDLPQDARGIVGWRERIRDLYETGDPDEPWYDSLAERQWTDLVRLARRYDAQYLVTRAEPRLAQPPVYQNNPAYRVYKFPDVESP